MAIRENDIGTVFVVTVEEDGEGVDISGASGGSDKIIKFHKPSGVTVEKVAAFVTDGTDGQIRYISVDGDLDESGLWHLQGYVNISGSATFHTSVDAFEVGCNL